MGAGAGLIAAAALAVLAGLHLYWAEGGTWPSKNRRDLAERLIGPDADPPPRAGSWAIAGLLLGATAMVLARVGGSDRPLVVAGVVAVAGVLSARGVAGLVWSGLVRRDSEFAHLDRRIYSPLCLSLAALTTAALTA